MKYKSKNLTPKVKKQFKLSRKTVIISSIALAVCVIGGGIWYYLGHNSSEPVYVYPFQYIGMTEYWGDSQESYGPVTTDKIQTVFLSDTQTVTEVCVKEGDEVKKGDLLMTFDTTLDDLALERKRLEVEKLKLQMEDAKKQLQEINSMEPMEIPDFDFGGGAVEENPGWALDEKDYQKKGFLISTDKLYDGSAPEKALICWLKGDTPVNDAMFEDILNQAYQYQNENAEGGIEPTDPTKPSETEPESSETESSEPESSETESSEPESSETESSEPESSEPDTSETTKPTETEETSKPTETEETTKPTETEETSKPTETEETSKPTETEETTKPTETEETTKPTETEETTKPTETEETTKPTETEETTKATETSETTSAPTDESTGVPSSASAASGDSGSSSGESEPPEDWFPVNDYYVVMKITAGNTSKGQLLTWQGFHVSKQGSGYSFRLFDASPVSNHFPADEEDVEFPGDFEMPDFGSGMTAAQIAQMRSEQQKKIKDLEFEIKMAEADYKIMQTEISDGNIYSTIDGSVISLLTEEEAKEKQQPMIKVSGGGGFYVEGAVNELDKDQLKIGQEVTINDWRAGGTYTGTVQSIGDFPNMEDSWNGVGNPNASFYPFQVFVDESADLQEGSYVSVVYSAAAGENGIYLQNPFIRSELGRSYVLLKGEDGRLEKRFITTGKALWGSYTEVLSGITEEDLMAFPYGKNVKPGVAVQEGDMSNLYG